MYASIVAHLLLSTFKTLWKQVADNVEKYRCVVHMYMYMYVYWVELP